MSNESNDIKEFGHKERTGHKSHSRYKKRRNSINKTRVVVSIVGIVILIMAIMLSITNCASCNDKGKSKNENKETKQEETTPKQEETSVDGNEEVELVALSNENEVYELVMSYIDAAYVKCDATLLEAVVDSVENIDVEKNTVRQRYIESYNNVSVYMLDGKENINVVFVTYEAKLYNYDTMLPSGETLKVIKNQDGKYLIHNIEVGEQFETHMINEKQIEELGVLQEKIQYEYNAVIEGNTEIKSIVDILNGAKIE